MRCAQAARRFQAGFTYLGVLLAIALLSAALGKSVEVWHTERAREQERQLLFVGNQYRLAIERYYRNTPGSVKQFPPTLEALLEDERLPGVQRYLRRLYPDPVTGLSEWGLVKAGGGIRGVHSLSADKPFKTSGFGREDIAFEGAERYSDWVFFFRSEPSGSQRKLGAGGTPGLN